MRFTSHAGSRKAKRNISGTEVKCTIARGKVIDETFTTQKIQHNNIVVVIDKYSYKMITCYKKGRK